jgi:DNA-binding SARP family transcriptional activator
VDRLWPELAPDAAVRDFKVALNALNRALEPSRPRGAQPFFIIRRDNLYGLNPQAQIYMDVTEFEAYAEKDDIKSKQEVLRLYKGEFLADCLYNEWSDHRREQIKQKYLFVCESLAEQYVSEEQFDEAINLCEKILQVEPTWEASYRLMMRAYDKKDNRSQVFYTYQRCKDILFAELGVEPTEATKNLFQDLCAVNLE